MNRKKFLILASGTVSLSLLGWKSPLIQDKEKLSPTLVKEFVSQAHKDIDEVKNMLQDRPTLLNAAHDWGNGDFELAIEGACHVGNKEIVKYLLEQGAPPTLFTMALFGQLELLRSWLQWSPESLFAKGPHGLSLLHHARVGGAEAQETMEFLIAHGLRELKFDIF